MDDDLLECPGLPLGIKKEDRLGKPYHVLKKKRKALSFIEII